MPFVRKNQDTSVTVFGPADSVVLQNGTKVMVSDLPKWKPEDLRRVSMYYLPDNPEVPSGKVLREISYKPTPEGVEQVVTFDDALPALCCWSPHAIVKAAFAIDEGAATRAWSTTSDADRLLFVTARLVREDDPKLLAVLAAGGIGIDKLKAALTK